MPSAKWAFLIKDEHLDIHKMIGLHWLEAVKTTIYGIQNEQFQHLTLYVIERKCYGLMIT